MTQTYGDGPLRITPLSVVTLTKAELPRACSVAVGAYLVLRAK